MTLYWTKKRKKAFALAVLKGEIDLTEHNKTTPHPITWDELGTWIKAFAFLPEFSNYPMRRELAL